jgi:hypothetical protein
MTEDVLRAHQRLVDANWPADLPRVPYYPIGERPLPDYLRHWAATTPDAAAII